MGFKDFFRHITESQALRALRSYGGMTCYVYQNVTYIVFKNADQMHKVCHLHIYIDENNLLYSHPLIERQTDELTESAIISSSYTKVMSTQIA